MPELSNNFIKGRMNKDLDERLVANGEYRDALNIEVSTSEGSNVGTVQTVKGNKRVNSPSLSSATAVCVGAIADEKNDTLYWFVADTGKDMILKYHYDIISNSYITTPVLVDTNKNVLKFDSTRLITGISMLDDMLFWTDNFSEPKKINITKCIEGTTDINTHTKFIVKNSNNAAVNYTAGAPIDIRERHITLIKKSPLTPPHILMSSKAEDRGTINCHHNSYHFTDGLENLETGDIVVINENDLIVSSTGGGTNLDWRQGDIIVCTDANDPGPFFTEGEVRLSVEEIVILANGTRNFTFRISSITNKTLDTVGVKWWFCLEQEPPLFELKFPRFATRYKYQDGEYSAFSPFSKVAFLPGAFDYSPIKGFNLGMTNTVRVLKIQNFVPEDSIRPDGVVSIDILYKESNSPNVYVFKTITTEDKEFNTPSTPLTRGEVVVTKELVHSVVQSNQLLRPWDNVPRLAKSMDVTANRIVFGNYVENYNLIDNNEKPVSIDLVTFVDSAGVQSNGASPVTSLKSLRTYQLGIVYRDKYGRETPVLSGNTDSSRVNIKKLHADDQNKFRIKINNEVPKWADSFKFFVKETSSEYYNLAMDRWYEAGDGNVWISFPSAERNKVDEDTYLILKKQHDKNVFVKEEARYKIIAIENEAPDYIKRQKKSYGEMSNNTAKDLFGDGSAGGYPEPNSDFVYINKDALEASALNDSKPTGPDPDAKKYIRFTNATNISKWYEISSYNSIELNNTGTDDVYYIKVTKPFGKDLRFTTYNSTSNTYGTGVFSDAIDDLQVEIAKEEDSFKPEFKGRFFVKIYRDGVLEENLLKKDTKHIYKSVWSEPIYYLHNPNHFIVPAWNGQIPQDWQGQSFWGSFWSTWAIAVTPVALANIANVEEHQPTENWWRNFGSNWFLDNYRTRTNHAGDGDDCNHYNDKSSGGITTINGQLKKLHLSFAGVYLPGTNNQPEKGTANATMNPPTKSLAPSLDIGVDCNLDEKTWVDYITKVGTIFKWSLDPTNQMYVVEDIVLEKSGSTKNDNDKAGYQKDEFVNYDRREKNDFETATNEAFRHAANKRVKYTITIGKYEPGGLLPTDPNYIPGDGLDTGAGNTYNPIMDSSGRNDTWNRSSSMTGYITTDAEGQPVFNPAVVAPAGQSLVTYTWDLANHHSSAHPIEILEKVIDPEGDFSSTNPAIWETEPKETAELDIYYEASQANPVTLDATTNETYIPRKSVVTLPTSPAPNSTETRTWTENIGNTISTNIIVTTFNDNVITINARPTYTSASVTTATSLQIGDVLLFTKPDGGKVTGTVKAAPTNVTYGPSNQLTYQTIELTTDLHRETYYLDYHNCFSFGNGVESNRIRDDFNAVTIDKGPKASATVAEPYEEERKKNGLIYSGIYNSTSGVNNLNQFIQAEKITKDLSPRFGSIQKLFAMDGNLNAFCEDKVVKIMANKDAVFNADGNPQLIATNRVLGQAMPYAGEYGISKNPESFANRGYQSYFSDKARGAVLRLSGNGITPISDNGMKDWFHDNLKNANQIIGSYDEKKALYNITLKAANVESEQPVQIVRNTSNTPTEANFLGNFFRYGGLMDQWASYIESGGTTGQLGITGGWGGIKTGGSSSTFGSSNQFATSQQGVYVSYAGNNNNQTGTNPLNIYFNKYSYGGLSHIAGGLSSIDTTSNWDLLIAALSAHGAGNVYLYQTFYHPTQVADVSSFPNQAETVWSIQSITYDSTTETYKVTANWLVGQASYQDSNMFRWSTESPFITSVRDNSKTEIKDYTVSFATKTNGWVSFKSWIQECGLSVNGKFYTLKTGNLYEHHSNEVRNNFYDLQYESTIDVLLNQSPTTVKSFQTLKYSGSQSRITKNIDTTNFDNQYYNNIGYDGWYAGSVETDLQSGAELEFKPKENKWFTSMQGVATYFNSDSDTNVDVKEFSVQGIDYCSTVRSSGGDDNPTPTDFTLTIKDDPSDH